MWRDHRAALEALACWPLLERGIPDTDDGETLTLAVEAPAVGFAVLAWAAPAAEPVLGRRLACRVRRWVRPALIERGIQEVHPPHGNDHRREGEIVTLNDPAWRLWRAKAAEIEASPCAAALAGCLPDDLDQSGLALWVGSVTMGHLLRATAGEQAARVLGVPIRPLIRFCTGRLLGAEAAQVDGAETGLQGRATA